MPDAAPPADMNVRAASYLIAHTLGTCGHCDRATRLAALVVPPQHEVLEVDDIDGELWSKAPGHALLFYIDYLNESVRRKLLALDVDFRFGHSVAADGCYWANHCTQCGRLLDDHGLFCEPGGAFLPVSAEQAACIQLVAVQESLVASAGGYAHEVEFFDSMTWA